MSSDPKPHAIRPPVLSRLTAQALGAVAAIAAGAVVCWLLGGGDALRASLAGGLIVLASAPPVVLLIGMLGPVSVSSFGAIAVGAFGLRTFPSLAAGLLVQRQGGLDAQAFWMTYLAASVAVLVIETWMNIALLRRAAAEGVTA